MGYGGKRENAGRPKGRRNKKTLERAAVLAAFNERVMRQANELFNAQLALSVGSVRVFRVDEEEDDKGKIKRVHTLVTDTDEIKSVLDTHDGDAGIVGDSFYFISEIIPDNRAIDSMLNRALGKPKDSVEHFGKDGGPIQTENVQPDLSKLSTEELLALREINKKING